MSEEKSLNPQQARQTSDANRNQKRDIVPQRDNKVQKRNPAIQQGKPPVNPNPNPNANPNQVTQKRIGNAGNNRHPMHHEVIISVVIPLLNEEESLPELSLMLEGELDKFTKGKWEVIFVDDGSTDSSFNVIKKINERNRKFRAIRFRRNYGKSAALSVGFAQARGMIIVTMDADLQDDPAEIQNLVAKLKEGYDVVSGWKKKRYDPINKTIPSRFFNFITSLASGIKLHDFNCGLKVYRREAAKSLQVYGEMHRYLPALAHWNGFKVTELPVQHHPRRFGKTKFGASRFIKGCLDLLTVLFTTRYLKRPLHFFGAVGIILGFSGFAINVYLLVEWLMGRTYLSNRPLALFGIALIIVGVQSVSIGLLGEMLAKNSLENANYSIRERI